MKPTREQRRTLEAAKRVRAELRKADKKARPRPPRPERIKHEPARPDRGRERDPLFLAYLRRQPCEAAHLGGCDGPIEAAHIRYSDAARGAINPGMGRKNHDRHANPLCHHHHQHDQHKRRERDFWARLGKDAYDTAAGHFALYSANASPSSLGAAAEGGPPAPSLGQRRDEQ